MKNNRLTLATLTMVVASACVDGGGSGGESVPSTGANFDFVGLMASYADNIILPAYQRAETQATSLAAPDGPIAQYCAAVGTPNEATTRSAAQSAWRASMDAWQEAEAYLVGPVVENGGAIRTSIYSFFSGSPLSTCAIDQAVVLAIDPGFDLSTRSANQRGVDALEYLLFRDDLMHTCPAQIVETQDWDMRPELERKQLRCDYAMDLSTDLRLSVERLQLAWNPGSQNFRTEFINPDNISDNLEALSDSLFYIEIEVKDLKLGVPTGIRDDCSQVTCAEAAESPFSDSSLANIRANLVGFRDGLTGGSGLGFDDIIAQEGFSDVNMRFLSNTDAAIELIDTMNLTLSEQLALIELPGGATDCANSAANPDSVQIIPACSLHGYLKRITDSLRTEFVAIIDVDLPDRAGGDSD